MTIGSNGLNYLPSLWGYKTLEIKITCTAEDLSTATKTLILIQPPKFVNIDPTIAALAYSKDSITVQISDIFAL